jgi:hypothetical protein
MVRFHGSATDRRRHEQQRATTELRTRLRHSTPVPTVSRSSSPRILVRRPDRLRWWLLRIRPAACGGQAPSVSSYPQAGTSHHHSFPTPPRPPPPTRAIPPPAQRRHPPRPGHQTARPAGATAARKPAATPPPRPPNPGQRTGAIR